MYAAFINFVLKKVEDLICTGQCEAAIAKDLNHKVVQQIIEKSDNSGHLICWSRNKGKTFDIFLVNDPLELHETTAMALYDQLKFAAADAIGKENH